EPGARGILAGGAGVAVVTAAAAGLAAALGALCRRLGTAGVVLEGLCLKPAFAARRLAAAAGEGEAALRAGDLPAAPRGARRAARRVVGRHLVSRGTDGLSASHVASAAVESVAENLTDSVAAPLLWYAVGGLPAAWAYRALNTADAMWGYRDARYERFGKAAARLDDAVNLLPARAAAAALAVGAAVTGEDGAGAARLAWRGHARTAGPDSGSPVAPL